MTDQWIVLMHAETANPIPYGPFDDETDAGWFAGYLSAEVDPAHVIALKSPVAELLGFWRTHRSDDESVRPDRWPPSPGEVWTDRDGDRWICTRTPSNIPYLVCIAKQGDDSAAEIWRLHGPLTFHKYLAPNVEEPPF